MKNIILIFCCLPFVVVAQKQLLINGKLRGLKEGSLVYLNDANVPTDTIARGVVKNAVFTLKGSLREPLLVSINFVDAKKKSLLFLDNNIITVTGDINDVQKLSVIGSPTQTDFQAFQDIFNPLFAKYSEINQQSKMAGNSDSLQIAGARAYTAIQENIESFMQQHSASPVCPFLLIVTAQLSGDPVVMEKRFDRLALPAQQGFFGKYLRQMIDDANVGAVGSAAIDFIQKFNLVSLILFYILSYYLTKIFHLNCN